MNQSWLELRENYTALDTLPAPDRRPPLEGFLPDLEQADGRVESV